MDSKYRKLVSCLRHPFTLYFEGDMCPECKRNFEIDTLLRTLPQSKAEKKNLSSIKFPEKSIKKETFKKYPDNENLTTLKLLDGLVIATCPTCFKWFYATYIKGDPISQAAAEHFMKKEHQDNSPDCQGTLKIIW